MDDESDGDDNIEMSWQVNEEVSRDVTGEADGKNQGVDSRDGVMHIWLSETNDGLKSRSESAFLILPSQYLLLLY